MKVAVITCYRDPDYIRARALRASLALIPGVEVIIIKNSRTGILRYPEVIWKLLIARFTKRPDVYLLTFRGYEMLPFVRLISLGKPMIYDELVNAYEWFVLEHKKLGGLPAKVFGIFYRLLVAPSQVILADTESHADLSSTLSKVDRKRYAVVPVGTDESVFTYRLPAQIGTKKPFNVFFYGYMLPLHGPEYVVEAAEILKDRTGIAFIIAGRTERYIPLIKAAQSRGANITYREWVPFDELAGYINSSAVNIAGPFGNTVQAQHVINGKTYQFLAAGALAMIGENQDTRAFVNHVNCLSVPQGDAQAIAAEIVWAYEHADELPTIIQAGRALYEERYSNQVIAGQLRQILTELG